MANPYTRQSSFSDGDTINSALFNEEYDQLVLAFSSTVGHTHDGSSGEGAAITKLGPTQDVVIATASILPKTNNIVDLGSSSLKFKDGYFAGNVTVDGVVTHSGNMTIGNAATDTLTINATIQGSSLVFEGATANAHELTLAIPDVGSDVTITLPNSTDTLVGKATTDVLTSKTLTSPVINTGVSGSAVLDSDTMSGASATTLSSSESIKAYVDTQVATVPTGDITSVVAGAGLTGGATSGDATLNVVGGTGITANADDIAIDSTVVTLTGSQALSSKTLTSPVINTGVSGTAVLDEDNMATNSATQLATQQSIKAYVDTQVATVPVGDITSVVAGAGLTGGATSGAATVNVVGGTGITANADDIAIDSTVATLTGSQVLSSKTLTSPVLNTGVSGSAILDEDNMASDSATKLATQQSIKAYVDSEVSGGALTTEQVQDIVGGMVTGNTESGIAVTYEDGDGTLDFSIGQIALTTIQTAANQTAHLALTTEEGDVVVRSDENKTYMHNGGSAGSMSDFTLMATPTDAVTSVAGNTGVVTNAHIAAAVEAASGSNTFTDADHTKLNAIEANATIDQTASEILTLIEDGVDSVHYKDASIDNEHLADNAVDTAEIADDAVTADKLANSINTAIAANTAKVTNATHTGDVTGATALTIAAGAVDIAMMSATGTASSSTFLRGDNAWTAVDALPSQSGHAGKYLTTDASSASWATLDTDANTTTKGLYEHEHTIDANYSISSGSNGMSAGPITISSGVSVTVPTGSTWVIV